MGIEAANPRPAVPCDSAKERHLGFEILLSPDDVVTIFGLEKPDQVYELIRPTARSPLRLRRRM